MTDTYGFTLLVTGADVQTDEALNALAEARCAERNKLWRWAEVASRFAGPLGEPVQLAPPSAQRAANALLDLRASTAELSRAELSRVRQELARLARRVRLIEMASPASLDAKDERWSHADSA